MGDVLQLLKDLKIDDNTLVVFSSDNGPSIESYLENEPYAPTFFRGYGPFDGIKRDTWEGGMREPTLARWPAMIPAGRVVNHACGHWDWLATFAEAAGLPAPAASDGVSLMAALTGRGEQRPGTVYIEYFQPGATPDFADFSPTHRGRKRGQMQNIYLNGHMGVRYNVRSADDDFEIYDLAKDPQEAHDLGEESGYGALQAAMKARVLQLRVPNSSAPRPYDKAPVPPAAKAPGGTPGLTWSLFNGEWPWLPDFRSSEARQGVARRNRSISRWPGRSAVWDRFRRLFLRSAAGRVHVHPVERQRRDAVPPRHPGHRRADQKSGRQVLRQGAAECAVGTRSGSIIAIRARGNPGSN